MNSGSIHPATRIQGFFSAIAERYDLANHLLSGGLDLLWRRRAASEIARLRPHRILDLATGSGDLALLLAKGCPAACVVGADFCLPMLEVAKRKKAPNLIAADGLKLPFAAGAFDAVTIAFGFRNMVSWTAALAEISRVLRPGGTLLILDFSMPTGLFGRFYQIYLHHFLPRLARLVTGEQGAYEYLGDSIERFPQGLAMEAILEAAHFGATEHLRVSGGVVSLYLTSTRVAAEAASSASGDPSK